MLKGNFRCDSVRARPTEPRRAAETTTPAETPGGDFQAFIRRNTAMTPRDMGVVVICFAVVAVTISLSFLALGFWLILPFAGLEVLAVAMAVAFAVRGASDYESITVTEDTVEIVQHRRGTTETHAFQRYWTRVRQQQGAGRLQPMRLLIGSHGRYVAIGSALTEEAKKQLARQLSDAMRRPLA